MAKFEYKVVPAPTKGVKAKGVKTAEGRFAQSVEAVLNEMGSAGWEYLRAELLPSDERSGLTGTVTNWRNVLVFRRPLAAEAGHATASSTISETGFPPTHAAPVVQMNAGGNGGAVPRPVPGPVSAPPRGGVTPPIFATRLPTDTIPEPEDEVWEETIVQEQETPDHTLTGIEKVVRRNAEMKSKKPT